MWKVTAAEWGMSRIPVFSVLAWDELSECWCDMGTTETYTEGVLLACRLAG